MAIFASYVLSEIIHVEDFANKYHIEYKEAENDKWMVLWLVLVSFGVVAYVFPTTIIFCFYSRDIWKRNLLLFQVIVSGYIVYVAIIS